MQSIAVCAIATWAGAGFGQANQPGGCSAQSGALKAPVVELYTSEGCSSCPPADQWLSTLKTAGASGGPAPVLQAFHVGYWDYIGWVDRFASPAHTTRQRQVAAWNRQVSIYTPQAVLNGHDWPSWGRDGGRLAAAKEPAGAQISLRQAGPDHFEALVTPTAGAPARWAAYWSLTEDGHRSRVKAGENAGELLQHDFVVRQYTPAGEYVSDAKTPQRLSLRAIAATPGHARRLNLVVYDPASGATLQGVSAACG
jgi:hypothetical protein